MYIEKIEPTFDMQGYNQLVLNEGRDGQLILAEELRDSIIETLEKATGDSIEVKANLLTDPREHDVLELRKINAKISSYSTTYLPGIPRAKNVELAASKVSQTILMPGEQFSYAKKVSPVSIENGYVNSTVFFNGRPVPGVGGGICQVSSTLYNAHLLAGITATERRNHSLRRTGWHPSTGRRASPPSRSARRQRTASRSWRRQSLERCQPLQGIPAWASPASSTPSSRGSAWRWGM